MIILDTNVVSALMRAAPDPVLTRLLDKRAPESIWTTVITVFEIRFGIERLPDSRRRTELERGFQRSLDQTFQGRLLTFDFDAAQRAGTLSGERARRGQILEMRDTMIAGIVLSRRAEFATRNTRHFADLDVTVIDPWNA